MDLNIEDINYRGEELLEEAIRSGYAFPQWEGAMPYEWYVACLHTIADYRKYHRHRINNMSHNLWFRIIREVGDILEKVESIQS